MITKSDKPAPKMAPTIVCGHIEAKYVRCGKAGCRCAGGALHGPYYRRAYWTGGQRRRSYVPLAALEPTREAVTAWRSERDRQRAVRLAAGALRALLRAYGRLSDELIAAWED